MNNKLIKSNIGDKNKIIRIIIVFLVVIGMLLVLDYFNCFNLINTDNLNWDFISIVFHTAVTLFAFILTYTVFNNYQNERIINENKATENQRKIAIILLRTACRDFDSSQSILNEQFIKDFQDLDIKLKDNLINDVFNSNNGTNELIIDFAAKGLVDSDLIGLYLEIKQLNDCFVKICFHNSYNSSIENWRNKLLGKLHDMDDRIGGIFDE